MKCLVCECEPGDFGHAEDVTDEQVRSRDLGIKWREALKLENVHELRRRLMSTQTRRDYWRRRALAAERSPLTSLVPLVKALRRALARRGRPLNGCSDRFPACYGRINAGLAGCTCDSTAQVIENLRKELAQLKAAEKRRKASS